MFYVELAYTDGPSDLYQVPLAFSIASDAEEVAASHPQSILATLTTRIGSAALHDATIREDFRQGLLTLIEHNAALPLLTTREGLEVVNPPAVGASGNTVNESLAMDEAPIGQASIVPTQGTLDAPENEPAAVIPVAPLPISAQPGEAALPPRQDAGSTRSPSTQRQPRESPLAGDLGDRPGRLEARASSALVDSHFLKPLPTRIGSAEQSNTSIIFGNAMILKLFRRLQPGENPDVEIVRFLTEVAHFDRIAPFLGEIWIAPPAGEKTTAAMLQRFVSNEGDGWTWFLDHLAEFFSSISALPPPPRISAPSFLNDPALPREALEQAALSIDAAALLGRRTAEMHLALATPTIDPAFVAEPFMPEDLTRDARRIDAQITSTLETLKLKLSTLKDLIADDAALLLSRRINLFTRANAITSSTAAGQRIRIHGDYHLGQTLRTQASASETESGDFVLIDFEGEPARSLAERRQKQSPLKDVAGMMRSFSYAAYSGLDQFLTVNPERTHPSDSDRLTAWAVFWQNSASSEFLRAYRETIAVNPALLPSPQQSQALLAAYLLEKALYELLYELNNRPAWLHIPLAGILAL